MEKNWFKKEVLPFGGMVAAELANVGSKTLFKAATAQGLSFYVFTVYASIAASLFLFPFALIFRRSLELPSNKISFFFKLVCLSALGGSCLLLGYKGLDYSSPTLASAMSNLIPAFTFILALLFRMEKVDLKRSSSIVKIIGSIVSISGALVVVLYKGPILISNPYSDSQATTIQHHPLTLGPSQSNWILGGLCFVFQNIFNSFWYILQGCLGQSFVAGIHTWGLHLKGPVYVSSFRPLSIAIAAATGVLFLGDDLYLGSVIGAIIIASGFYSIMWGKAKEEDLTEHSSKDKTPLLQSCKVQDD